MVTQKGPYSVDDLRATFCTDHFAAGQLVLEQLHVLRSNPYSFAAYHLFLLLLDNPVVDDAVDMASLHSVCLGTISVENHFRIRQ